MSGSSRALSEHAHKDGFWGINVWRIRTWICLEVDGSSLLGCLELDAVSLLTCQCTQKRTNR